LFFDPVVSGCNRNDDYHCDQDGGALHPAVFETFGGDAEHQGDDCGCAEDAEHLVFEGVNDHLPKGGFGFGDGEVLTEVLFALLEGVGGVVDACFGVDFEGLKEALGASPRSDGFE
jgi:hypothetical protein